MNNILYWKRIFLGQDLIYGIGVGSLFWDDPKYSLRLFIASWIYIQTFKLGLLLSMIHSRAGHDPFGRSLNDYWLLLRGFPPPSSPGEISNTSPYIISTKWEMVYHPLHSINSSIDLPIFSQISLQNDHFLLPPTYVPIKEIIFFS